MSRRKLFLFILFYVEATPTLENEFYFTDTSMFEGVAHDRCQSTGGDLLDHGELDSIDLELDLGLPNWK